MKKILFLIITLTLSTTDYVYCQTQAEMNITAFNDYEKADKKLNKVYKELMMVLNIEEKKLLLKAQKDWLKFRDSHCEFEISEYEGGSIQPLMKSNCLKEQTINRTDDLKTNLENRKNN